MSDPKDPRYPIGKFVKPDVVTADDVAGYIRDLRAVPANLKAALAGLTDAQLDTPYRDGGWTVRQVVHHLPDSHVNAYVRHKLAATEDEPLVKTYEEPLWAQLPDAIGGPIGMSLDLLTGLHARWTAFLSSVPQETFDRFFRHPDLGRIRLGQNVALYAWHGRHHVAHVTALRERMGW